MNTNFQKIKELIQKTSVPLVEQEELFMLFANVNDQDLESVFELFSEDSSWINKINENYKAKQVALSTGNQVLWQKIVQEEEAQLKELER